MDQGTTAGDVDLLRRISARDSEALACLYDRHRRAIFALAVRMLRNPDEAEEALSDVFYQAWRQASWYDAGRGSVGAWLVTICRSRCMDRLRARGRRMNAESRIQEDSPAASGAAAPDESAEASQKRRRILEALGDLKDGQRQAIELAYYEGLSHSEIAERLGEPLGTVKTRIRQGMITLRERLAAQFGA